MPNDKEHGEVRARVTSEEIEASASGLGGAAAASRGTALAAGQVAAAAGVEYSRADGSGLPAQAAALVADINGLSDDVRAAMKACLAKVAQMQVDQARIKDAVDDLCATDFASAVRRGSPVEDLIKALLQQALKLGVPHLASVVGAIKLPKAP